MHVQASRLWNLNALARFQNVHSSFKLQVDYLSITQMAVAISPLLRSDLIGRCYLTCWCDTPWSNNGRTPSELFIPISLVPKFSLICGTERKEGSMSYFWDEEAFRLIYPNTHTVWWKVMVLTQQICITRSAIYNCELIACDLWEAFNSWGIYHKYTRHS